MSTLFSFPSKNQLNAQGAVTENPGSNQYALVKIVSSTSCIFPVFLYWSCECEYKYQY